MRRRNHLVGIAVIAVLSVGAAGSPQTVMLSGTGVTAGQGWVHTWGGAQDDSASAVTTDANGNVYATGATSSFGAGGRDVILLEYDTSGNLVWQRTWGGTGDEYGTAVAVDSSGNIYVTGGTTSFGAGWDDVFLVKFNSSGNIVWSRTWGGSSYDVGYDISFDSTGNLYVAAETYSFGRAAVLLKYDVNGSLLWQRTWKGPATYDAAYTVTVDSSGDVIEAGISWDYSVSPNRNSILLLKFDGSGNLIWNRNWAGPSEDEAWGTKAVQVDPGGNIYVAGRESATCTSWNFSTCDFGFLVLKLDPSGNMVWAKTWDGSTGWDGAGSLVFDAIGNLHVTGVINNYGSSSAAAHLTFDTNGNLLSSVGWTGTSPTAGLSITASGSALLVAGSAVNNSGSWQAFAGTAGTETGALSTPSGSVGSPTGSVSSPSGMVGSPNGVLDTGGGGTDVFVASISISPAPAVSLTPSTLAFPDQLVGTTSMPQAITLTNTGTANLTISSVSLTGTNAGDFAKSADTCSGASVVPSGTCTVSVTFTPSTAGSRTASLTVTSNAPGSPHTVNLSGVGVSAGVVSLSPTSLTFGGQAVGTTSSPQAVTLTNTGTGSLGISSISTSGDFLQTSTCGPTLAAGASCIISVSFSPTAMGSRTGILTIVDAAGSPHTVSLIGTGASVTPGSSITSVFPTSGFQGQTITDFTINGARFGGSIIISNTPVGTIVTPVPPNVEFSGSGITANVVSYSSTQIIASVTIAVDAGLGARDVTVTGGLESATLTSAFSVTAPPSGSPVVNLSAGSLSFPSQPQGTTSSLQTLTLTNTGTGTLTTTSSLQTLTLTNTGTGTLTISSITPSAGFEVVSPGTTCSADISVGPGTSCNITVGFTPSAPGTVSGTLTISDNAPDSPQKVFLTGIGMAIFHQCDGTQGLPGVPTLYDNGIWDTCLYGCALTSSASLLTTYKTDATPQSLDTFLSQPDRYSPPGSGNMDFSALHLYLSAAQLVDSKDQNMPQQDAVAYLKQEVTSFNRRVILRLLMSSCDAQGNCTSLGDHYVVATGPIGDTDWGVFDPGWNNASPFDNLSTLSGHLSGFTVTTNTGSTKTLKFQVVGVRAFAALPDPSAVEIQAQSPVELLITDPQGRRLGNLNGRDVFEIPSGSYFRDFPLADDQGNNPPLGESSGVKTVYVPLPLSGDYSVVATGTGSGNYKLNFRAVARDGTLQESTLTGVTAVGSPATYQLNYATAPGSPLTVTRQATGPIASLSRTSLSFGGQLVGTTSSEQTVTLTNTGDPELSIAGISVSGDFAQTNNCGISVAIGATCTISLLFKPTAAGARTGTLTINDNAPGNPHTVALSGTGTDFALAAASGGSTSATVNAGQTATYNLQVAPTGFVGNVALSCAWTGSQPRGTNCTVSPTSVNVDGTNAAPFTATVTTTARSLAGPRPEVRPPLSDHPRGVPLAVLLLGLLMLITVTVPRQQRMYVRLGLAMALVVLWAACGGGGGATPPPSQTGTPAGTYTLTVSGTASGISRTATLTLKVN